MPLRLNGSTSGYSEIDAPAVAGDQTFTLPGTGGVLLKQGDQAFTTYAIIADQKAQNTAGGTFTSGAWRTRDLNTEIADPDGIVSISSNQFTLDAGTYLIRWSAPAYGVNRNQSILQNITAGTTVGVGGSMFNTNQATVHSQGSARVVLTGSTVFEIQHRCQTTNATNGFGAEANFGTEQYTIVEIFKEA